MPDWNSPHVHIVSGVLRMPAVESDNGQALFEWPREPTLQARSDGRQANKQENGMKQRRRKPTAGTDAR